MKNKIRLGMVGGGKDAFIGAVHRMAARMDDKYDFVAGCLSSTPEKSKISAKEINLDLNRSYPDFRTMAEQEAKRADGIEVVSIVTPNWSKCIMRLTTLILSYRIVRIYPPSRGYPVSNRDTVV